MRTRNYWPKDSLKSCIDKAYYSATVRPNVLLIHISLWERLESEVHKNAIVWKPTGHGVSQPTYLGMEVITMDDEVLWKGKWSIGRMEEAKC